MLKSAPAAIKQSCYITTHHYEEKNYFPREDLESGSTLRRINRCVYVNTYRETRDVGEKTKEGRAERNTAKRLTMAYR